MTTQHEVKERITEMPEVSELLKLPLKYDLSTGQLILNADGRMLFQLRGWGYLTGTGGLNLDREYAAKVQDQIGETLVEMLNSHSQLQEENKRLREAFDYLEMNLPEFCGGGSADHPNGTCGCPELDLFVTETKRKLAAALADKEK